MSGARRTGHGGVVLLLLLASAPTAHAQGTDARAVLQRVESRYARIATLRADFTQTLHHPMLGAPETARGVMYLAPPGRFAMRFAEPAGDRIVADGTWLWAYTPSTVPGQVIRQPIPRAGASTPDLFRQFVDRPLERYDATFAARDTVDGDPVSIVRLTPRAGDMPFEEALLAISDRTSLVLRLTLRETSGQRREITFSSIAPGAVIPPAEVEFRVPAGVRVVTP